EMPARTLLAKGMVERIGDAQAAMIHQKGDERLREQIAASDHEQAMAAILARLMHTDAGNGSTDEPIGAVGHRVVHGGEESTGSVLIDDAVIASIEKTAKLAPLHNPPNLTGIRAAVHALPDAPQ